MQIHSSQSFQIRDPETGSALALLLAAAGYELETDICDGTAFIAVNEEEAPELPLLDEAAPQWSAYDLACELRERLDRQAEEAELATLSSAFHDVA